RASRSASPARAAPAPRSPGSAARRFRLPTQQCARVASCVYATPAAHVRLTYYGTMRDHANSSSSRKSSTRLLSTSHVGVPTARMPHHLRKNSEVRTPIIAGFSRESTITPSGLAQCGYTRPNWPRSSPTLRAPFHLTPLRWRLPLRPDRPAFDVGPGLLAKEGEEVGRALLIRWCNGNEGATRAESEPFQSRGRNYPPAELIQPTHYLVGLRINAEEEAVEIVAVIGTYPHPPRVNSELICQVQSCLEVESCNHLIGRWVDSL